MLFLNLLTSLSFALHVSNTKDQTSSNFDLVQLSANAVEPKEKKYQTLLDKQKYEKLLSYYKKQEAKYSVTDREEVYKKYYTPARIAYASTINTPEAWEECLVEIPKSSVYQQYRSKYPLIEKFEFDRTVQTKDFKEWSWFLALYSESEGYTQYLDEYERFHFDEIKDSGDIELLLVFLQEHPNGKLYTSALGIYNELLIEKCEGKYQEAIISTSPDYIQRILTFFFGVYEQATPDVQKRILPWFTRLKIRFCEVDPSKACYEDFLKDNPSASIEFTELANQQYEDFVFSTAQSNVDWEFFIERFPLSSRLAEAKVALRAVRFEMIQQERTSLEEESITFAETFLKDYRAVEQIASNVENLDSEQSDTDIVLAILDQKLYSIALSADALETWTRYIEYETTLSKKQDAILKRGLVYYRLYSEQKAKDPDTVSIEYLRSACTASHYQACFEEGEYLLSTSVTQGLKRLNLACDYNIDAACVRLADLYFEGKKVKSSSTVGRKYLLISCEKGGEGCNRLLDLWEKDRLPVESQYKRHLASRATQACSSERGTLCVKAANALLGHEKGYAFSGDMAEYFTNLDRSFDFIRDVERKGKASSGSSLKDQKYAKGDVVYYCNLASDGQSFWAHKVKINTESEGENLLGVSLVESVGKSASESQKSCSDKDCFNLDNKIVDYDEISPTLEGCGTVVREVVYLKEPKIPETTVNSGVEGSTTQTLTDWKPKSVNNIQYTMSLSVLVPSAAQSSSEITQYIERWLKLQSMENAFAFDGLESISTSNRLCDERYDVCSVDAELLLYRNTSLFREPIRLERLVQSYELYNTVCTNQLRAYPEVDKGDDEEWACLNAGMLSKALQSQSHFKSINAQSLSKVPMSFEQLVSRRCLLESKKTLDWERQSCDFAYRNLNLLADNYMKVLEKSCSEKAYKACGLIGNLYYKSGNTEKALPQLKKACDNGDKLSCEVSYQHYSKAGDVLEEYFGIKACNLGSGPACLGVAIDYWNEAKRLYRDAQYYRDGGFLADSEKYFSKAHRYSSLGCKIDEAKSCLLHGYSLQQKGQQDSANVYFDRACHNRESKACAELYQSYSFGNKYSASLNEGGRYRSSQRSLLKGVKGYKSSAYDRVRLRFDQSRQGTPKVDANLKYDDGVPYIEVVMYNTEGVIVKGAKMYKSYDSNTVSVSGKIVSKVVNLGDESGISVNGNLTWKIQLKDDQFSHLVITTSKPDDSSYNEVYIDIVF